MEEIFQTQWYQKGLWLIKKGEYWKAIKHYSEQLEKTPYIPEIYNNLGIAYLKLNCLQISLIYLNKCLSIKESDYTYYNRGLVYYYISNNDLDYKLKSIEDFNRAIELNSNNINARNYLNKLLQYFNCSNYEEYIHSFNKIKSNFESYLIDQSEDQQNFIYEDESYLDDTLDHNSADYGYFNNSYDNFPDNTNDYIEEDYYSMQNDNFLDSGYLNDSYLDDPEILNEVRYYGVNIHP